MKISFYHLILVLLTYNELSAQLSPPFQLFSDSLITSGFFKDQSPGWLNMDEYSGEEIRFVSSSQGQQLFLELGEAALLNEEISTVSALRDSVISLHAETGAIPLVILDFCYERIVPWAIPQSLIDTTGGIFTPLIEQENLIETRTLKAVFSFHDEARDGGKFIFNPSLYLSNMPAPDNIEFNLNNGNGFVPLIWGEFIEIPESNEDIELVLRISRNNQSHIAGTRIKRSKCNAPYGPDYAPWSEYNDDFPWRISADYNGETVYANAYIKYRNGVNGTISRPFIFVEGIDFDITNVYPDKYGNFGWCEFSSGNAPGYNFLYNMPDLIESLRADGFDIIFLDFLDGADLVQKNSTLLRKLLDLIEIYKVSDNPNVVSGASMGGQITRYTLAKMEEEGVSHCSNLWISLDSPHLGANIPIGLQQMLLFLSENGNAEAQNRLEGSLLRPAAQQMLIDQLYDQNTVFNDWYSELESLGFPKESRNIALSNGAIDGLAQEPYAGTTLIDYSVDFLGDPAAWLKVFAAPGVYSGFPGLRTIFSGRIPTSGTSLPDWLGGDCIPYDFESTNVMFPENHFFPHESVPGSTRPTIEEIVEAINSVIEADGCDAPLVPLIQDTHSFISTQSALAIQHDNLFDAVDELLFYGIASTPFDAFYAPYGTNERHSEISDVALEFVLNEVREAQFPITEILAPGLEQPAVFNFGSERMRYIHSLKVGDGGRLYLNAQLPVHFGEDPNWIPEQGSLLEVRIGSCGSGLELKNGAEMHIGDVTGSSTARLIVSRDAYLAVEDGAKIFIHPGSELVLEGLSVLSMYGGIIEVLDGGKLSFLQGNHTEIYGNIQMFLSGAQSQVVMSNDFHLNENVLFEVIGGGEDSQILVEQSCQVNAESGAMMKFFGNES